VFWVYDVGDMSFPPATSERVGRVGDRSMRNALFFYQVSRHLFSAVGNRTGNNDNEDKTKIELARAIRWRYIERLAPKVRQIGNIERRRWIEAELGLRPGTLKTPAS
jgi:hypothetical protein